MTAEDLARILDELGQRLGPTGEYVFALAVRQVYIDAAVATVFLLLSLAPLLFVPRMYRWAKGDDRYGDRGMVALLVGLGMAAVGVSGVVNAFYVLPNLLNPEYAALRDILGAIR